MSWSVQGLGDGALFIENRESRRTSLPIAALADAALGLRAQWALDPKGKLTTKRAFSIVDADHTRAGIGDNATGDCADDDDASWVDRPSRGRGAARH